MWKNWLSRLVAVAALLVATEASGKKYPAGRPAFQAGDPEAYHVWHDDAGWHLRMTCAKKSHAFHGVLRGQGVSEVKATKPALQSKIEATATAIRFDFDLSEGAEGFDWKATGPCTTFELKLDGLPKVDRIHVGAKGESPAVEPFDACV